MVDRLVGRDEPFPAVDQQDQPGQPLGRRAAAALLLVGAVAGRREQPLPALELLDQPAEQPVAASGLVAAHHGTAVRQGGQRCQRAAAAVEPVQVQVGDVAAARRAARPGSAASWSGRCGRRRPPAGGRRRAGRRSPRPGAARREGRARPGRPRRVDGRGGELARPSPPAAAAAARGWPPARRRSADAAVPGGVDQPGQVGRAGRRPRRRRPDRRVAGPLPRQPAAPTPAVGRDRVAADPRRLQPRAPARRRRAAPRGRGGARPMSAASRTSTTSVDSAGSVTRSAIRRLVFARMSALTTPPGRWVASTRCTPSERPRWAMPTRPPTKSGSSSTRVANSSTTRTSRGSGGDPAGAVGEVVVEVLAAGRPQHRLAAAQLGAQRPQRALGQVAVQVGHGADGVRQPGAVAERRAALVVDQDEGHLVRPVRQGQPGDQGLQQLGLARAGGPGDQGVRAVGGEVDDERLAVLADAEHDPGAARADPPGGLQRGRRRSRRTAAGRAAGRPPAARTAGRPGSRRAAVRGPGRTAAPSRRRPRRRPRRRTSWRPAATTRSRVPTGPVTSAVARHSTGSDTRSRSRQSTRSPTSGPSSSSRATPGCRRSALAPSRTTTVVGPAQRPVEAGRATGPRPGRRAPRRARRPGPAAGRRRPPTRSGPPSGPARRCGSHRAHSQSRVGSARSSTRSRCRGLCQPASWATSERASGSTRLRGAGQTRGRRPRPADTVTGTSARTGRSTASVPARPSGLRTSTAEADACRDRAAARGRRRRRAAAPRAGAVDRWR